MADFTQKQLEEMVVGKTSNPNVIFFEHAALNVPNSKQAGRRVYDTLVYIKLSQPGVDDNISYLAQKEDVTKYPDEYQYFLNNKGGRTAPGVEIIPGLDIAHLQELRDYGILTVAKLAEMEAVPPHLSYAHRAARVLNQAFEDMSYDEESSNQTNQETNTRIAVKESGFKEKDFVNGRQTLPETGGLKHTDDVDQLLIPSRAEVTAGETARGSETGRQVQRSNPLRPKGIPNLSDNWELEITY
jgi:hypothetical protein